MHRSLPWVFHSIAGFGCASVWIKATIVYSKVEHFAEQLQFLNTVKIVLAKLQMHQINVFSMQIHFVHMDFSLTQFNRITRWIFIWMHCVHCELSYRSNGIICGDQLEVLGKMAVAAAEVRPCIKVERSKWNGTEKKVHQIESNSLMKRIDYIFSTSFFVKMALLT